MEFDVIVVGSGPAGVSAARAALACGRRVTMLDVGLTLEAQRRDHAQRMAAAPQEEWLPDEIDRLRGETAAQLAGVPLKYLFGSDFPYREAQAALKIDSEGVGTQPSFARGGFSTVWGSAVLPYLADELVDWPIDAEALAPHHRAVAEWLPIAGVADDLASEFPLFTDAPQSLQPSPQAAALLRDLERSRSRLGAAGIRFGRSRLAVRAHAGAAGPGCSHCGLCLHGCPYGLIYDAGSSLEVLRRDPGFEYRSGVIVERVAETSGRARVSGRLRESGEPVRFEAERVFLGCGVLATTRILLASLEAYNRPVEIKDSQYFLLPLLRMRGVADPRGQQLHTLAQAFLELRDPSIDPHNIHLQIYSYASLYADLIDGLLGPMRRPLSAAAGMLLSRLFVIQGYLHSDSSAAILATLGRNGAYRLEERPNDATRPVLRRVLRKLLRHSFDLRAVAMAPALQVAPVGRGFHSGGSFPMHQRPEGLESDVWGRPVGFERVHAVDATVFPTIPSTTITFTVMANAHRIASQAAAR